MEVGDIKAILDQLARFHAASYTYINNYKGGLEQFKAENPDYIADEWIPNATEELKKENDGSLMSCFGLAVTASKEYGDVAVAKKAEAIVPKVVDLVYGRIRTSEDEFNCLIHNDAWCNNFMFNEYDIEFPSIACLQHDQRILSARGTSGCWTCNSSDVPTPPWTFPTC